MKKIAFKETEGGIPLAEIKEMFGEHSCFLTEILQNYSVTQVVNIIKAYEEKRQKQGNEKVMGERMTREEAINYFKRSYASGNTDDERQHNEALDVTIKSLENEQKLKHAVWQAEGEISKRAESTIYLDARHYALKEAGDIIHKHTREFL